MPDPIVVQSAVRTAPPAVRPARRWRWANFNTFSLLVILGVVGLLGYTILQVVVRAVQPDTFLQLFAFDGLGETIFNTVVVVVLSTLLALIVGSALAWLNERTDARMGVLTDVLPFVPFLMPPIAGAIGWALLTAPVGGYLNNLIRSFLSWFGIQLDSGPFDIYSFPGLIFVYAIYLVPYVFLMVSAGIRNLDPQLEEQSRVAGVGPIMTFVRVTVPGLATSLAAAALLLVWTGFGKFAVPVAIAAPAEIKILSVETVKAVTTTYPPNLGLGVMLSLITVAFVGAAWYAQVLLRSRSKHAVVGGRSTHAATRAQLGWARWPARVLIMLYIFVITVLPLAALLIISLDGVWRREILWDQLSFESFHKVVFEHPMTQSAILNSLQLALIAATFAAVIAALASAFIVGNRKRWVRALDGTLKLPVILSTLVIALGFIFAFGGPPFFLSGTLLVLIIAFVVTTVPKATVTTDPAAAQVGGDLREASEVAGAKRGTTFWRIYLPIMLPSIAIAWMLVFIRVLGDLEMSVLLAGTRNPTIGYQTMMMYSDGSYADVASLTLVVIIPSAVLTSAVLLIARKFGKWNTVGASTVPSPNVASKKPANAAAPMAPLN